MIRIFISYSSADASFADRLASDLTSFGMEVFYAKWEIKVGDSIIDKINEALASHDHLIIILSRNSVKSKWVKKELNSSLIRQLQQKEISIKPILIENCKIPPLLSDIKYADFRNDYNDGFNELISSFQNEFDLERFIQVVKEVGKRENLTYNYRYLAILLKRHALFSSISIRILSLLSEKDIVSKSAILDELGRDELVLRQIDYLIENGFIESKNKDEFKISALGQQFLRVFSEALGKGIVSLVCPH